MSAPTTIPSTYRAWQFNSTKGGLEKNLEINPAVPLSKVKPDQHLVQVIAASLNPIDYKASELGFLTRFAVKTPATPGIDFAGRIVQPADGSSLKPGQLVFGGAGTSLVGGAIGEYTTALDKHIAALPEGVSPFDAASSVIAGVAAYQTIAPFVKEGSTIFINGGSGGTGSFGIQFAKALGCYVVTTCSTQNVELCKSLGADEVIDYTKGNLLEALKQSNRKFDHVVDNVGNDNTLFWKCHEYTKPGAIYSSVGATMSLKWGLTTMVKLIWPGFLGGGKRKLSVLLAETKSKELAQMAEWMRTGQVKPVIDSRFSFEEVPKAYEKLKTGRVRGKIVIDVAGDAANTS